ncbi:hypothetical protein GSI_10066 [Ganoderma sinense ZZ0214-1]|uniref:Uncharacterized protein n=1 Tax=Ganoderma sinense ZZ0214-1 TaxID=1077348 RepID=A0A2G8S047_9APHY|nr:hypothetical protein GSI_10066 [Ganoderma sinense ZZ0214-1]
MALLEGNLKTLRFYEQEARWTNIYIRDDPTPDLTVSPAKIAACLRTGEEVDFQCYLLINRLLWINCHFHFAKDSMRRLLRQGYSFTLFQPRQGMVVLEMKEAAHQAVWIVLGECLRRDACHRGEWSALPYWVRLVLRPYGADPLELITHDCEDDHISFGMNLKVIERTFKYYDSHQFCSVKLSFTPAQGLNDGLELRISEIGSIQPMPEDLLAALPVSLWDRRDVGRLLKDLDLA